MWPSTIRNRHRRSVSLCMLRVVYLHLWSSQPRQLYGLCLTFPCVELPQRLKCRGRQRRRVVSLQL